MDIGCCWRPDDRVADLLQQTYVFDEVVIGDVAVIIDA